MHKTRRGIGSGLLVVLSALSAIGIILGKFLAFNVTEFMRFSLENTTIIFSGIVFGPLYGAAVGAVQDLVGCIAVGYTINPIITLGSAIVGLVSGTVFRCFKKAPASLRIALSVLLAHASGSVIIKSVGLAVFYSFPFTVTVLWRILNYTIVGAVESTLLYLLIRNKQILVQINKITPFSLPTKMKSTSDVATYAKEISGVFSKPGLDRVEELLERVGNPQKQLKIVHVAGTNGKGSVSAMLSSILRCSGLKVGSFNSPYLYEMRESIQIDGNAISEEYLISIFERLRQTADSMADKPTEFELLSAAAYLAFSEAGVDVAVVECGMGGERDATNVIDSPLLSIITGISIDHTSFLGNTTAEIAKEKAGIIKRGCDVLIGRMDEDALRVIYNRADEMSATLHLASGFCEVKEMTLDGTLLDCHGVENIKLPLLGIHQVQNARMAIKAAHILRAKYPSITYDSIREGIEKTRWRARFEILMHEPLFIYDGAHNLDGVKNAVESVRTYLGGGAVCLSGVLADKEYEAMADEIATVADYAVTVTPDNPRALSASEYSAALSRRGVYSTPKDNIEDGVRAALEIAVREKKAVICLGSLYLYRNVTEALEKCKTSFFDN